MNAKEILKRSNKNLTNKFTGMSNEKVSGAIMDKFQFRVQNNGPAVKLAIIPSYHQVQRFSRNIFLEMFGLFELVENGGFTTGKDVEGGKGGEGGEAPPDIFVLGDILLNRMEKSALVNAGYPVDVVLADRILSPVKDYSTIDIVMSATNPTKKIGDFLDYIKTNPCMLKELIITSSDISSFATDMEIAKLNPFSRTPEQLIDLNKFVSKYQNLKDRVNILFDQPLEISDLLLWTCNIPTGADMTFTLRF